MLKNLTRKRNLTTNFVVCRSVGSKARGLMFTSRRKYDDKALIFEFSSEVKRDLHMFFVFYPIDVMFLDSSKRVVELKCGFRPFTLYSPRRPAKYIVELPEGLLSKTRTVVGDVISW